MGPQPGAQVEEAKHGGQWDVHPCPVAYSHVNLSNRRKMAPTWAYIHVHGPPARCTGQIGEKWQPPGRASTSRGPQPGAQVEQAKNGGHGDVYPRPGAHSLVDMSNRRVTGTCINVQRPTATCTGRRGETWRTEGRSSTSNGPQPCAQVEQEKNGDHRDVH